MKIEDFTMVEDSLIFGHAIVDATFEEWITYVFDHPPAKGHWRWNEDFVAWAVPASETVAFLARTFDESGELLKRFSDHQVDEGLEYISSKSLSDISLMLWDESVPWPARQKAVRSIRKLYSDCFAVRCAPILSHLAKTLHPLNDACYMWWDEFSIELRPKNPTGKPIDDECLTTMGYALGLESVACQESALHGLGHRALAYPDIVQPVIEKFITANPDARPELLAYARRAQEGKVL